MLLSFNLEKFKKTINRFNYLTCLPIGEHSTLTMKSYAVTLINANYEMMVGE